MTHYPATSARRHKPDDGITIIDQGANQGGMSMVRAELHGRHIGQPNRRSATTYLITQGQARISVGDETFQVSAGDIVTVDPNTRRELEGKAQLVIVNVPPFDPADETT